MSAHDADGPLRPTNVAELRVLIGRELGPTDWHEVRQSDIDAFAEVSGDHQWIHVDPVRGGATDWGATIAHGLYTLSLGPGLSNGLLTFEGFAHALNYGYDKVRFPSALPTGSRVRLRLLVVSLDEVSGGLHLTMRQTFEREGHERPVAVATALIRIVTSE